MLTVNTATVGKIRHLFDEVSDNLVAIEVEINRFFSTSSD
jgi:hypothetical protein